MEQKYKYIPKITSSALLRLHHLCPVKSKLNNFKLKIHHWDASQKKNYTDNEEKIDNICEECQKIDESVSQNLILSGYKLCKSCRISKTLFPI